MFMADTTPDPPKAKTPNRILHEEQKARNRRITLDDITNDVADGIETRNEGEDLDQDHEITRGKIPKMKKRKRS